MQNISAQQITEVVAVIKFWLDRAKAPKGFKPGFHLAKAVGATSLATALTALQNLEAGNYNFLPNLVAALTQILSGLHGLMLFSQKDEQREAISSLSAELAQSLGLVDTAQRELEAKANALKEASTIADQITEKATAVEESHEHAKATTIEIDKERVRAAEILKSVQKDEEGTENLKQQASELQVRSEEIAKRLTTAANTLDELQKSSQTQSELIAALLPKGASAGLASSFGVRVQQLELTKWIWMGVFLATIAGLATLAVVVLAMSKSTSVQAEPVWMYILHRLPLATPLIWLGWFSAIQYGNTLRVQEDYAFKEATSKAFEGYRSHMERLAVVNLKDGNTAMELLAAKTIEILAHEPLRIFEKAERDVSPSRAILEAFTAKTGAAGAIADSVRKGAQITLAVKPPEI